MTDADRPQLAKMLVVLGATFNEPLDDFKIEGYFAALKDLPYEAVRNAGFAAMQRSRFFPRPAEIREFALGTAEDAAELAWNALLREIRQTGYTGKPTLPDATWEAVREIWGSWVCLCQTLPAEGPELLGWAKRFKSTYRALASLAQRPALPFGPTPAKELSE